jgi:hypothetical protein
VRSNLSWREKAVGESVSCWFGGVDG